MAQNTVNLLFSEKYRYLAENIMRENKTYEFNLLPIEHKTFPDREKYHRILNSHQVRNRPAVYICGTVDDYAILEAYNLACTLVRKRCSSLHIVIPYFGYSTMERAVHSGEVVTAKNIARLFSSVPLSAQGNFIYMIDLHAIDMQYYFEGAIHPIHLMCRPIVEQMIADLPRRVVLASTDMGRAKWIEKMSNLLGLESAYIMKKRLSGSETEVIALNAEVKGKDVAIFDDMIRSGGSIINAAKAYKQAGAANIYILTIHGVFTEGSIDKMKNSGIIQGIYCTNTHANTQQITDDFVKIYDVSSVILDGLEL